MENIEELEERVDELYSKIDFINAELYSLGGLQERLEFFEKLRELIAIKDSENDVTASAVLGWAYENLGGN
jgi:hypothetical protein